MTYDSTELASWSSPKQTSSIMTADQLSSGSQPPEPSGGSVKDDSQLAVSLATPRLENHSELKTQNTANSPSPLSPISPAHPPPIASARETDDNSGAPTRTQNRNHNNDFGNNRRRNQANSNRTTNRLSSTNSETSEVKPYLAAPFQADPAIYNAAAAAAAAAQASAPHSFEKSSPTTAATPLQQYTSPANAPRPPYIVYPNVVYYPGGQSTVAPNQEVSAFFNPATSPVSPYDSSPGQWAFGPPHNQSSFNARPPPPMMMSPASGRNPKRTSGYKLGSLGQHTNNVYVAGPTTVPPPGHHQQLQQQQQQQQQPQNRMMDPRINSGISRNVSDVSTISNSSSFGRAASNESLGGGLQQPMFQQYRGGTSSRRESLNNSFSPNYARAASISTGVPPSGSDGGDSVGSNGCTTNLYVRGLAPHTTDESLYELCKGFGRIYSSKAILDLVTQECKGFGFVMYDTDEETRAAFDGLVGMGYQVSYARTDPRSPSKDTFVNRLKSLHDDQSTNIYVSNLPANMDEDGLIELLLPRTVVSAKILRDPATQKSRGVGFARLETRDDAISAIHELHGKLVADSFQHLQARFADSVAQKRFKINSQPQFANAYGLPPVMSPYMGGQVVIPGGEEGGSVVEPMDGAPTDGGPSGVYYDQYAANSSASMPPFVYPNNPAMYYNHQTQQMYYGSQFYAAPPPNMPMQYPATHEPEGSLESQVHSPSQLSELTDLTVNDEANEVAEGQTKK
ncbi:hypothetical protein BDR26DRAFT_858979 [Obelidium mucronatum]|nr:hypothetical protein BDR26DRAFT_858979 [Obelidium mucronatum]